MRYFFNFFFFYCEDSETLKRVTQRCGGVFGDIGNLTGHSSGQPVVGDPALSSVWARQSPEVPFDIQYTR